VAGLEPRGFTWVIAGRLAVCERIGGYGFQHRRVRREEEIAWLKEQGINAVFSLLPGNQNQAAYEAAGFTFYHRTLEGMLEPEEIDEIFARATIPVDVDRALLDLVASVGRGGPVAVRSSATVEDMHGSSFAGQYRSVLDVDSGDPQAVRAAIRAVWASLWHPAPSAYRDAFGIDQGDVAMAVVVMAMIPATTAGVVFTDDPGGSGGARVEAVEGLGESLV